MGIVQVTPACVFLPIVFFDLAAAKSNSKEGNGRNATFDVTSRCLQRLYFDDKLVVAARKDEDVSWMALHLDVPFIVMSAEIDELEREDAAELAVEFQHSYANVGREAMAYLTFIVQYYDCLAQVTAFIHAHRTSWHSKDMAHDLKTLRWREVGGYLPLHRHIFQPWGVWANMYLTDPGKHLQSGQPIAGSNISAEDPPEDIRVSNQLGLRYSDTVKEEDAGQMADLGKDQVVNGTAYPSSEVKRYDSALHLAAEWRSFFGPAGLGPLQDIRYYCCAQFAVTKERILARPRSFYVQAIEWLHQEEGSSWWKGWCFEALWHVILGESGYLDVLSTEECKYYACK